MVMVRLIFKNIMDTYNFLRKRDLGHSSVWLFLQTILGILHVVDEKRRLSYKDILMQWYYIIVEQINYMVRSMNIK